jgi:hypothetical protein
VGLFQRYPFWILAQLPAPVIKVSVDFFMQCATTSEVPLNKLQASPSKPLSIHHLRSYHSTLLNLYSSNKGEKILFKADMVAVLIFLSNFI